MVDDTKGLSWQEKNLKLKKLFLLTHFSSSVDRDRSLVIFSNKIAGLEEYPWISALRDSFS